MTDSGVVCPGANAEHPHNLQIIDENTGNLLCMFPVTEEYQCPFSYHDSHKIDYWRIGYNPATGKYEK